MVQQIVSVENFAAAAQPPPSQAHKRMMTTPELLDESVEASYTGPTWEELQRRLVSRAFGDLELSIRSGAIYGRCARARVSIPRRDQFQVPPYSSDIAAEAIEECLRRFRSRVLPEGEWNPGHGVSLEDFFTLCCLPDVANRWRFYLRQFPESSVPVDIVEEAGILTPLFGTSSDPTIMIELKDLVAQAIAPMPDVDRKVFALLADGWSPEEISHLLKISVDATYARMSRRRRFAQSRRVL
jgi:hypothetical protein